MPPANARRFTMVQLFVVIGMVMAIGIFLIGSMLPRFGRHGDASYRIKCASNLRQIGLAMKMYANGEIRTGAYPRTRYSKVDADHPVFFTNPNATNPFASDGPAPNDITAALFLTLRTQEMTTDVYVWPQDKNAEWMKTPKGKDIQAFSNFLSPTNLSYSMQNPYPTEAAEKAGFVWADSMNADFAIMADKNPGVPDVTSVTFTSGSKDQRKANSPNHDGDGQNVLYADGHVDWSASVWAGAGMDNIYGHNAQYAANATPTTLPAAPNPPPVPVGIIGPPADGNDSVLLPIATK